MTNQYLRLIPKKYVATEETKSDSTEEGKSLSILTEASKTEEGLVPKFLPHSLHVLNQDKTHKMELAKLNKGKGDFLAQKEVAINNFTIMSIYMSNHITSMLDREFYSKLYVETGWSTLANMLGMAITLDMRDNFIRAIETVEIVNSLKNRGLADLIPRGPVSPSTEKFRKDLFSIRDTVNVQREAAFLQAIRDSTTGDSDTLDISGLAIATLPDEIKAKINSTFDKELNSSVQGYLTENTIN